MSTSNNNYHVSDELWTVDGNTACKTSSVSWIEAGEATKYHGSGTWYFWADCRPGSIEYDNWQYVVPSGDYGLYHLWFIWKTRQAAPTGGSQ